MKSRKGLVKCTRKGKKGYVWIDRHVVNNLQLMEVMGLQVVKEIIYTFAKDDKNNTNT